MVQSRRRRFEDSKMRTKRGNQYTVSDGNLKVLETVPHMMESKSYRKRLRLLTFEFLMEIKKGYNPKGEK